MRAEIGEIGFYFVKDFVEGAFGNVAENIEYALPDFFVGEDAGVLEMETQDFECVGRWRQGAGVVGAGAEDGGGQGGDGLPCGIRKKPEQSCGGGKGRTMELEVAVENLFRWEAVDFEVGDIGQFWVDRGEIGIGVGGVGEKRVKKLVVLFDFACTFQGVGLITAAEGFDEILGQLARGDKGCFIHRE